MTVHTPMSMTKEAFFAWIEQREERYEYARGRVIQLPRVTLNHAIAVTNLRYILARCLNREAYDITGSPFAVHVGDSVRLPDVMVEPAQDDGQALQAKAPILIVEVLSPSTLHVDFGDKRQEYLGLPTLDSYVIVAPDEPRVWIWQRADGAFPSEPEMIEGLDRQIVLPALGVQFALSEIYRGIL